MNIKTNIGIPLGLCAAVGCAEPDRVGVVSQALTGIEYQGIEYQGIEYQGMTLPGAQLESLSPDDFSLDGVQLTNVFIENGTTLRGVRTIPIDSHRNRVEYRYPDYYIWQECGTSCSQPVIETGHDAGLSGTIIRARGTDGTLLELRIEDAWPDDTHNTMVPDHEQDVHHNPESNIPREWNIELYQYAVSVKPAGGDRGDWERLCEGTFLDGSFSEHGSFQPGEAMIFACNKGVAVKCLRGLGYKWWRSFHDGGGCYRSLGHLYQACTRALTADYCGDGESWTKDGTAVSVWDNMGYNQPEEIMVSPESYWIGDSSLPATRVQRLSQRRWEDVDAESNGAICDPKDGVWPAEDFTHNLSGDPMWTSTSCHDPDPQYGLAIATSSHCAFDPCEAHPGRRLSRGCAPDIEQFCDVAERCCDVSWDTSCRDAYIAAGHTCYTPYPTP